MELLYKIASFIWDIPIERTSSPLNPQLDVVWSQGIKMLHSKNANYSFGSLHQVFKEACKHITKELEIASSVLILGFGGGSILDILDKKYTFSGSVTGIDYDPKILELFQKHFAPDIQINPQLIATDARVFLTSSTELYDIVFVDLFQDLQTDSLLFDPKFATMLHSQLKPNGVVLINTILPQPESESLKLDLLLNLNAKFKSVNTLVCQEINTVFIAK